MPTFTGSERDLQAFQFFLNETTPILDQKFSTHEWIDTLLSIQGKDSIVHRACLAVGSLHRALLIRQEQAESNPALPGLSGDPEMVEALRQYIQAIRLAHRGIQTGSSDAVAIKYSSILLALFSSLHEHNEEMQAHLYGGIRLITKLRPSTMEHNVDGVLAGNGFLNLLLNGSENESIAMPLPSLDADFVDTEMACASVRDARGWLHKLVRASVMFKYYEVNNRFGSVLEQELTRTKNVQALLDWQAAAEPLRLLKSPDNEAAMALLDAQWELACSKLDETGNAVPGRSEAVVAAIERHVAFRTQSQGPAQKVFSFQTGIIPMLLGAAYNTQEDALRRRILVLLHQIPHAEGAWTASAAVVRVESLLAGVQPAPHPFEEWLKLA